MFNRFKVVDKSMEPSFKEGDFVLINKIIYVIDKPKINDVIVAKWRNIHVIKRINDIVKDSYFLKGDNEELGESFWVMQKDIVGKVWVHAKKE